MTNIKPEKPQDGGQAPQEKAPTSKPVAKNPPVKNLGVPAALLGSRPGMSRAQPISNAGGEGRHTFAAGEVIFQQGDGGGDLFFIEEGVVEIYTKRDGETVILSEMIAGEIVGVMTCMTSEPRMASARAKTAVTCKKVQHQSIKKVLDSLPNWMKIVIKEFSIRLTQMNKMYSEAVLKIKRLQASQLSNVYSGAQIAAAFSTISDFMAIKVDNYKVVVIEDVLEKLELTLNLKREDVDKLFTVLMESGLLRVEIEPDRKRTVSRLENAQKLNHFAQFVRESKHGSTKKFIRAKFTNKETRVLSAMVKLAARLDMDLDKTCKFSIRELEKSLERATGVKFERGALNKGVDLKLVQVQKEGDDEVVTMKPSQLGRTVACVEAVRRLTQLDSQQQGQQTPSAAA